MYLHLPESAGIACVIALLISFFFYKDLKLKELPGIFVNTAITTAIVTLLIAMASLFGWSMTFERIPQMIAGVDDDCYNKSINFPTSN